MNSVVNQTVAVVDYGMGNLRSVAQAVIHATTDTHVNAVITQDPQVVRNAHRVVLPGQGAMADCMRELRESGLLESVLGRPPPSRCSASASACKCCWITAPKATRRPARRAWA